MVDKSSQLYIHFIIFSLHTTGPPDSPPMNIRASNITDTSFVVQWDEVDDALRYDVYVSTSSSIDEEIIIEKEPDRHPLLITINS